MTIDAPTIDWMIAEAKRSIVEGTLYEPRAFYDVVALEAAINGQRGVLIPGNAGAFFNHEQFPVRITHITTSLLYGISGQGAGPLAYPDERGMQGLSMRLRVHDSYYQSRFTSPLPVWSNALPTISDAVAPAETVWRFDRPLVLSTRDSLLVIGEIIDALTGGNVQPQRTVSVTFHGVGYITRRPYLLESSQLFTKRALKTDFDQVPYRNDGSEPIVLHTMVVKVSALTGEGTSALDATGDSRAAALLVSQIGNGTNAPWLNGPPEPIPSPYGVVQAMPVPLLGPHGGRAITHRIPGNGFVWEPGEGVEIDLSNDSITSSATPLAVGVGMLGYIAVR